MAEDFKYDPEAEENSKKTRLPFALCKANGIEIQDWWTPRNAWEALKNGGFVDDVSEEYKDYYRELKKKSAKRSLYRQKLKKKQLEDSRHNPDKNYIHRDGYISGTPKGEPMSFKQADSGNCNPFYDKGLIGYDYNCQTCVPVYIARRQGYDVRALPNLDNKNIYRLSLNTTLAYKNVTKISKPLRQDAVVWLESTVKQGEIYSVEFSWKGKSCGHIITCERDESGSLRLYDPQSNTTVENKDIKRYLSRTRGIEISNLTNAQIDETFCDKIMKKRS
jgi:hypothetical protein